MFVIPISGTTVPDPDRSDFLPIEGREVEAKQYWFRRVETGEVTIGVAPTSTTDTLSTATGN